MRTRTRWRRASGPLLVCLDQVTDPHNLGAVCRSAEGAGASGVVIVEHSAARVTRGGLQGLGRAPWSTLRSPSSSTSPATWRRSSAPTSGSGRRPRRRETSVWAADFTTGTALVLGAEGRGLRPGVRRVCDDAFAVPLAGEVESLNVSVTAGIALFEAARQRRAA